MIIKITIKKSSVKSTLLKIRIRNVLKLLPPETQPQPVTEYVILMEDSGNVLIETTGNVLTEIQPTFDETFDETFG